MKKIFLGKTNILALASLTIMLALPIVSFVIGSPSVS
ncbi:hypothetical protein CLACE_12450 [Clostridium acetobutylicum]|nr:hypothetical protein [Clostridium acetobutylicum]NYC94171.1 hypothetical protein [Clostridium acetobutylicum]OOL99720.1 hypothetical protein CLACE_12450 [Clostridium acetobutylicum]OOM05352.1 hypothetical protein CLABU_25030 [Clostridium acetobutylicum]